MVFKRYSNPFLFLDNLIETGDLEEGIDVIIAKNEDEIDWQLYLSLNPWNNKSFVDWKKEMLSSNKSIEDSMNKQQAEEHFKHEYEKSQNILKGFKPPKK